MANNNPGNIIDTSWTRQQPGYAGTNGRFAVFDSPQDGMAAMASLLGNYHASGLNTISGIVNKWAPPSENPTGNYIQYVAQRTGIDPTQPVDNSQLPLIAGAMSEFETGNRPGKGAAVKQFDAAGNPVTAQPAPVPLVPVPPSQPQPQPAASSSSDDDLLLKYLGDPAAPSGQASSTTTTNATSAPNVDDALLQQYLGTPAKSQTGASSAPTPLTTGAAPIATGAPDAFAGKPITPGALGNNPMAVHKPPPSTAAPVAPGDPASPSSMPWLDSISAGANAAVNAIPIVGPTLTSMGNNVDAGINNLLGFPQETPQDRAAIDAANAKNNPIASGIGTVVGTVAPYVIGGGTILGGKLLGTTGNMLTRMAMGGLSSGAIQGADTVARGGSPEDATKNALLGTAAGALGPLAFGGNLPGRLLGGAGTGAILGGGGTLAAGGSMDEAQHNALIGAGIGAGAGALGAGANKLLGGGGVNSDVAALADSAVNKFGIPLRAGQITTNPLVNRADALVNKLPLSGGTASYESQIGAFTNAVAKEMGESAPALTPSVMGRAKERIGSMFDSVAARTPSIPADSQFDNDILNIVSNAQGAVEDSKLKPIMKQFDNIMNTFNSGGNAITGQQYQSMTARNSLLMNAINSGGDVGNIASQMKEALDGALQRAAPADAVSDLAKARYQWKVMRTVEDLAEKSPTGGISPPLLMGAVRKNFPNMAYDGGGNMGDLARIGQQFLKPPNSSGAAENLGVMKALSTGAGLTGGGMGIMGLAQNPGMAVPAIGALAAAGLGSSALGGAMRSKMLTNMLIQSGLATGDKAGWGNLLMRGAIPETQNQLMPPPGQAPGPLKIVVRGANPIQ